MRSTTIIPRMRSTNGQGDLDVLRHALETLDAAFFNDPFMNELFTLRSGKSSRLPKLDMYETETSYEIDVNIAGLNKDEVQLEVADNYLILSGEKKEEGKRDNGKYLISELSYKKFYRQIPIPGLVNYDAVEAKHDNGILHITLPKIVEVKPTTKKIDIK